MEAAASVHSREPTPWPPEVSRIAPESSRRAASGGPFCFLVRGRVAACRLDESLQGSEMGASSEEADPGEAAASLRGLAEQRNVSPSRLA